LELTVRVGKKNYARKRVIFAKLIIYSEGHFNDFQPKLVGVFSATTSFVLFNNNFFPPR